MYKDIDATLKHNKREKKAFAQGLNGGKPSRRTPRGCLARKTAKIPEVVKVNNYQKINTFACEISRFNCLSIAEYLHIDFICSNCESRLV
jgi:hypothetical protein